MMDIEATEAAYVDLRRAFEYGQMNALSYQAAIDELCVQDDYGRYWMIGAETGEWYYHDGCEWIQADPRDGHSLPFMDEHGVYWVLGQNQHDWYYYDGSAWILPGETGHSVTKDQTTDFRQTDTQYYQDDEGRYWAIGAKSGKWYYYDQDGWHLAEEDGHLDQAHDALEVPQQFDNGHYSQPSQTDYQDQRAYFAGQSVATELSPTSSGLPTSTATSPYHTHPTQSISPQPQPPMANPSPSVQTPQPTSEASVSSQAHQGPSQGLPANGIPVNYVQPHGLASPAQPVYNPYNTQPVAPNQFSPTDYSQIYTTQPYPQSIPVQSPPPNHINPEPDTTGVWYYYPDEGSWCYYDGEKWIVYYDNPEDNDTAQAKQDNNHLQDDDHLQNDLHLDRAYSPDDFAVEIDDGPEQATGFDDNFKETKAKQAVLDEAYLDKDETDIEEVGSAILTEDDNIIEIEDLDDFIEVIEVVDEDIIEQEDDLVEAEFEVSVYKPGQEPVDPPSSINSTVDTATAPPFAAFDNRATAPSTIRIPPTPPSTSPEGQTTPPPRPTPVEPSPPHTTRAMPVPPPNPTVGMRPKIDTSTQASPLPRTEARPQTSAMPKAATQPQQEGQLSDLLLTFPMWLWTSFAGGSTLILTAVIIIFTLYVLNNLNQSDTFARIQPTQTLPAVFSGAAVAFEATPTAVVPSLPASDSFSLAIYSNENLGFSLSHAPDWVYREYENTVIFAPSAASLDPNNLQGSALWISLSPDTSSNQRLAEVLANFEPITDRLTEGTMSIANRAWPSAQIRFQSATLGTEAVALVASTGVPGRRYTLVAAAPIHEWERFKPLVEISIQSFKFIDLLAGGTAAEQHFSQTPSNSAEDSVSIAGEGASRESASSGEERSRAALNADPVEPPTATPTPNISTPKPTATPTPTFTPSGPRIHIVASGDSLGKVASRYNVSIDDIVLANKMDQSDYLQIGQELYVPRPGDSTEEIAAFITDTPTPTPTDTPSGPRVHTVTSGDTLGDISVQYDVSVAEIVAANRLSSKNTILRLGQELIIPLPGLPTERSRSTSTAETARQQSNSRPLATSSLIRSTSTATAGPTDTPTPTEVVVEEPTAPPEVEEEATPEPAAVLSGRILYPAYSSEINSFNIWRSNLDGTEQEVVIFNASQPSINRSGTLLTYRSWETSHRGIFYQSMNGGPPERLTGFVEDALPTWAPDGSIVFSSRREGDRVSRLFRVYQEGGDGEGLGFNADNLDVMPNGNFIARGCTVSGDCGLWLVSGLGQGQAKISGNTSDTAPDVRPQGGRIAIMSFDRGGSNNWEIWLINEDGSEPLRLTENVANDGLPTWSPDGQSLAFVSDRGGVWAVWVMNVDGSNQRKLFNMKGSPTGQVLHDTENSMGWFEERIAWQP